MEDLVPRELWEYDQRVRFDWLDVFATIATALLLLIFSYLYQNRRMILDKSYRFFMIGLAAKMAGTLLFCSIYMFYYDGGDTISYFESSMAMVNLFYKDPQKYIEVMISAPTTELRSLFDDKTGYPYAYMFYDSHTFMVIKITSVLSILTGKSFFLTSLLMSYFAYYGVWKLFLVFRSYAPEIEHRLAIGILFFPSTIFWAGGVSKDTLTYMATALFVYSAHQFFIIKKRGVLEIVFLLVSSWLILSIKPYIFLILFPGGLLWIFYDQLTRITSKFISFVIFPIMILGVSVLSFYVLSNLSGSMSKFSIEKAFQTAAVTNYDLKQDYYGGSSFDIGNFDGTFTGVFELFFPALNAGLFRPYIWEGRSLVIVLAGVENFFLLFFTLYVLFKTKFKGAFKIISAHPIILFCTIFSVLFAFMIGLTTSNFGALVRFKIPLIPFYVTALFLIDYYYNKEKEKNLLF